MRKPGKPLTPRELSFIRRAAKKTRASIADISRRLGRRPFHVRQIIRRENLRSPAQIREIGIEISKRKMMKTRGFGELTPEKRQEVVALLKAGRKAGEGWEAFWKRVGRESKVAQGSVYKLNREEGNPAQARLGFFRKPTGVLSEKQISEIVSQNFERLNKRARSKYFVWRNAFSRAGVTADDIAQDAALILKRRLEIFDPSRIKKGSPEVKLSKFINFSINYSVLEAVAITLKKLKARKRQRKEVPIVVEKRGRPFELVGIVDYSQSRGEIVEDLRQLLAQLPSHVFGQRFVERNKQMFLEWALAGGAITRGEIAIKNNLVPSRFSQIFPKIISALKNLRKRS